MGLEIERKFLVTGVPWRQAGPGVRVRQGYLCSGPPVAVRVRVAGARANLNLKQATLDIVRDEFEYEIPLEDAELLLRRHCAGRCVEKTRYRLDWAGRTWEIDVFEGANAGLVVAEVELDREDDPVDLPPWAAQEVSGDPRYLNTYLAVCPFSTWPAP
jgi:adenylate cyclase